MFDYDRCIMFEDRMIFELGVINVIENNVDNIDLDILDV